MRSRLHSKKTLILILVMVCAGGSVCAGENIPEPDAPLRVLDRKQAAERNVAHPQPEYPPVAKVNYLQGSVQLELKVDGKGNVTFAHVVEGNAILAVAALRAARNWVYLPLPTAAGPAGFMTTVKIKFTLNHPGVQLTARQAERDFLRQVKLPQLARPTAGSLPGDVVPARVLVNEDGHVVDAEVLPTDMARAEAARESLLGWTFRPAHWGSMAVPSYLDVGVPITSSNVTRASASSAGN